ncbi:MULTISPECIES: hypothetical protein [Halobacterium]|uniref:DUF7475 family protein n=1 Tax=Halobacterium TaxID=2239 RepID=UPI00073EB245|nr:MULTISPECIES: hypothetical protein [Halobacterium]MCG1004941.1 hypothetical protein [Halobacterium noricense]
MATNSGEKASLVRIPSHPAEYIAVVAAVITAVIHLRLGPRFIEFSQTLGFLFILNGLGFLGGILVYVTRYWRRKFYLVAAGYAITTLLAFFFYGGFEGLLPAFQMRGSLNWNAVWAKAAEVILSVSALYLYQATDS